MSSRANKKQECHRSCVSPAVFVAVVALGVLSALADGTASLCDLRVNGMASPANVGVKPSFSWKTPSTYAWNGAIDKKIITFEVMRRDVKDRDL